MSDGFEHYGYCERAVAQATALLDDLCNSRFPDKQAIFRRRNKDRIVLRALYDDLRRAFLTPIDREDLWCLCVAAEQVLFWTEETVLAATQRQTEHIPTLWKELHTVCHALQQAVVTFPHFRRDDVFFDHLNTVLLRFSQICTAKRFSAEIGSGYPLLLAFEALAKQMQTAVLKNE